ncbi:MAG: 30S ribosome-binding factor RbfA [bacterium]|nr:MAG: 30S ribosome-binding factor RbfA [bacterium]
MARRRVERLGEQFRREITEILQREVKDPRIGHVTITEVEVTPDLLHARVYVRIMGDEARKAEALQGLAAAASFIRAELGQRLYIRRVPELRFELDRSLEHAMRIEQLLREVRTGGDAGSGAGGAGAGDDQPTSSDDG